MPTQQQRGAVAIGSIKVLTLPPVPKVEPWLKSNRSEDKTLVRFGQYFDEQMELWRRQVESSISTNFNTIRLALGEGDGGAIMTEAEIQAMIDLSLEGVEQGDTIIQGVTEERVTEIVNAANATFIWDQANAASVWEVLHNLGRYPPVSVVDSGNTKVWGEIQYLNSNFLTITFGNAFGGKAYLG